jgi:ATP-dependent 26S proteasome regulatory subunit
MRSVSPEECISSSSSSANNAAGWEEQQGDEAAAQPFRFDETRNSAFVSIATMDNDSSRYDNMMLSPPTPKGCDDDDVVNDDRLTLDSENVHLLDANATVARGVDHLHNRVSECDESDDLGENHQDDGNDDGIIATSDIANKQQQQSHGFVSSPPPPPLVGVSFRDIIGHSQAKLRLDEALLPLALPPDIASSVLTGIRAAPASILLHGPPGCGKTKLAKAMAGEAQAVFLSIGPSDILSKFVGESEASVRGLFQKARREAMKIESKCAVIFFDEIDALGRSRTDDESGKMSHAGGDNSARRVLAELLIQMTALNDNDIGTGSEVDVEEEEYDGYCDDDGYSFSGRSVTESKPRIIVVAATNRPEDCDPALLRRFAVRVLIGLPSRKDRKKIIKRLLIDVDHTITSIQLDELALTTEGWSGSDLESMTREAVMAPVRECLRAIAVLKRKESRVTSFQSQQRSGDDSSQKKQSTTTHSTSTPREALLNSFRNLRPVSNIDFEDGIAFFLGEATTFGINNNKNTHYDSSSSSEDEA